MIARISNLIHHLGAPRSLRKQLLAISLLILSGLLLLIGVLQYVLMRDFIYSNRAEAMETQIRSVPREFYFNFLKASQEGSNSTFNVEEGIKPLNKGMGKESMPSGLRNGGDRRPLLLDANTTLAIYSSDGMFQDLQQETLSDVAAPRLTHEQYKELLLQTPDTATGKYKLISTEDGSEHLAVYMSLGRSHNNKLLLQMSVNTGPLTDVIMQQLLIFAILSVIAILTGLFMYFPALRRTLNPLSNMGKAAQSIDAGKLDTRFPVDQGQTEIDNLSQSFNGMLERLEVSFLNEREAKEQMRRFAADASHELRTPLTSIHGFLEVLLRGAADNKEQLYRSLRSMHGESKRINKLVEDLLLLARMDGTPQLRVTNLLLDEVITEMEPQLQVLADNRKVTFDIAHGNKGMYDLDKIKQVILNLFQNAVQHTDAEHGSIHLSLHARGSQARLEIQDNGTGISSDHLPYVFDRFYRSDSSRTRKYGGSGLGLSITKSIVDAHGGSIKVSSQPGEGTIFEVTLPCVQETDKEV